MATDNKNDQYPGYPHRPSSEDITRNEDKVSLDANASSAPVASDNDADITADDLQILNATESNLPTTDAENLQRSLLDATDNDGAPLNESSTPWDTSGGELDVPGSEDDDANEEVGEEDEENNYYSLGGDNHENQEENKGE